MTGFGQPSRQPCLAAVTTHHNHGQRVVGSIRRRQADAPQVDERPQGSPLIDTVDANSCVPTWAIGSADTAARCGAAEWPCTPTSTPIASTAAAADEATQVISRVRRRRLCTAASNDGNNSGDSPEATTVGADSLIAATSSRSSWDSRAGTPQSSVTAPGIRGNRPGALRIRGGRPQTMLPTRKLHPTSRSGDHHPSTPRAHRCHRAGQVLVAASSCHLSPVTLTYPEPAAMRMGSAVIE